MTLSLFLSHSYFSLYNCIPIPLPSTPFLLRFNANKDNGLLMVIHGDELQESASAFADVAPFSVVLLAPVSSVGSTPDEILANIEEK